MGKERWKSPVDLRKQAGLTQKEVAAAIGRREQTISDWERGVKRPRLLFIEAVRLGKLYRVTMEDLARAFDRVDPDED
jgi:transcriptional regulator with XRE-family HTH domain